MDAAVKGTWHPHATEELRVGVHGLVSEVVHDGGAVGWASPPCPTDTNGWLTGLLAAAEGGDAGLVLLGSPSAPLAMGTWRRVDREVHRHVAEIAKVMCRPSIRGRGLGRQVMTELLAALPDADVDIVTLATRGNNHAAMTLYRSMGFREFGRISNGILVDGVHYDDVRFVLSLE
jgi:ribosomal protein S18 acetylase RimI-like enzyme